MRQAILWLSLVLLGCLSSFALAEVPDTMTYQGYMTDSAGEPLNGVQSVTFKIYGAETGTEAIWEQTDTVTFEQGRFEALLGGNDNPLDANVFSSPELWIAVSIGGGDELLPRVMLPSVPYATRADVAENAVGDITPHTVSVAGATVIDESGQWVGDPTDIQGPKGDQGDPGEQGEAGESVAIWSAESENCLQGGVGFSIGDAPPQFLCNGDAGPMGEKGDRGQKGEPGIQGETGEPGQDGADGQDCWDLNNNGTCDTSTEDTDGSGGCSLADCYLPEPDLLCKNFGWPSFHLSLGWYNNVCIYSCDICTEGDTTCVNWIEAASYCSSYGLSLCTYEELYLAKRDGMSLSQNFWMADRTADNGALYVNDTSNENNFDAQDNVRDDRTGFYCCYRYRD